MSRCGDVYENRVTGEYALLLRGTEDRGDGPGIAHLTARPGAAVVGEHFHPSIVETFTVLKGRLDAKIAGTTLSLGPGESATVEAGVPHDWWNSSKTEETQVLVKVDRAKGASADADRFELMLGMLFGLANAGKVDKKGRPYPLQAAVIAQEFADVVVFTHPPIAVQRFLIGLLAPIARALGYRAIIPEYCRPHGHVAVAPEILAAAGIL
jgi:mannose-6-phosphate isomerase-like protein (cupin superfamily)